MSARCPAFGNDISTSRSNRPGRRSAGSIAFGRLVVATTGTATSFDSPAPSINVKSCATIRFSCAVPPCRVGHSTSSSSITITHGFPRFTFLLPRSNTLRNRFSLSPAYAPTMSPLLTASVSTPASSATARTASVFPVPGGPCRSNPLGNDTPSDLASLP